MRLSPEPILETGAGAWILLYESPQSREQLLNRFGKEAEAHLERGQWLSFGEVTSRDTLEEILGKLLSAEVIVVAAAAEGDFTDEFKSWINDWVARRNDREGALVGIFHDQKTVNLASRKEVYLRHAAHLAGMDYLSRLPLQTVQTVPDSLDTFSERADQMTSVLDTILKNRPAPALPRRR